MKLNEIWDHSRDIVAWGFRLSQEEEREEDNSKIWHTITMPNGKEVSLDHSPYEYIDMETFKRYLMFYREHKRFPRREDMHVNGPLYSKDLETLTR